MLWQEQDFDKRKNEWKNTCNFFKEIMKQSYPPCPGVPDSRRRGLEYLSRGNSKREQTKRLTPTEKVAREWLEKRTIQPDPFNALANSINKKLIKFFLIPKN